MEIVTEVSGGVTVILMIIVYMLQWQTLLLLVDPEIEDGLVQPYAKRSTEMQRFQVWVALETGLIMCVAFGNFCYLFSRSFIINKAEVTLKEHGEGDPNLKKDHRRLISVTKDFLSGAYLLMGFFATMAVPLFISLLFMNQYLPFYDMMSSDERHVLHVLAIIQATQLFFVWMWIFASLSCCGKSKSVMKVDTVMHFSYAAISLFTCSSAAVISLIIFAASGKLENA